MSPRKPEHPCKRTAARKPEGHSDARRARKDAAGPCPLMHECGGCSWLGMPYAKQLTRKQQTIDELFAPLIKAHRWGIAPEAVRGMRMPANGQSDHARGARDMSDPLDPTGIIGARTVTAAEGKLPAPRHFRYKAATPFAPGHDGSIRSGFYAAGTHRIIPAADCPVEAPGARRILNEVARIAGELDISAYDEDTHRGLLRHAVLRLGWRTDEGLLTVVAANRDVPHLSELAEALLEVDPRIIGVALNVNPKPGNAIWGPRTYSVAGTPVMHDKLLDCTFEISPAAFYQTNPAQTEALYQLAIDGMALDAGDVLLDAYCGSGTIGIAAARAAADVGRPIRLIGVERNPAGIADARRNAQLNGLSVEAGGNAHALEAPAPETEAVPGSLPSAGDARFIAEDATAYLTRAAARGLSVDVLCLDPPRAGATRAFLEAACAIAPRRMVYVSCNPETQARDLDILGARGYALTRLTPVDMFPHTPHTETVAVLERMR